MENQNNSSSANEFMDSWAACLLANPVTKMPCSPKDFKVSQGIIDARVLLKNSYGFKNWFVGQDEYEKLATTTQGHEVDLEKYRKEIGYDRCIYEKFPMRGAILDIGGGVGTVREFLPDDINFVSLDPFIDAPFRVPPAQKAAYACLAKRLNFLSGLAEFLPFRGENFDWVHMRSMLDHVQVPDLALIEAHRVLKNNGHLLIGLYVEGGKPGKQSLNSLAKHGVKDALSLIGIDKWKDHHTWHPSYENLRKLVTDNNFSIVDVYWQPQWNDSVVYLKAVKLAA